MLITYKQYVIQGTVDEVIDFIKQMESETVIMSGINISPSINSGDNTFKGFEEDDLKKLFGDKNQ